MLMRDARSGCADKRWPACEHFVKDAPERKDIAHLPCRLSPDLLGGHVTGGPDEDAILGRLRRRLIHSLHGLGLDVRSVPSDPGS